MKRDIHLKSELRRYTWKRHEAGEYTLQTYSYDHTGTDVSPNLHQGEGTKVSRVGTLWYLYINGHCVAQASTFIDLKCWIVGHVNPSLHIKRGDMPTIRHEMALDGQHAPTIEYRNAWGIY